MTQFLEEFNRLVWGAPTLVLILGTGLYISILTGFVQLRFLPRAIRQFMNRLTGNHGKERGVSSFQALCTALAATVGTGNLAGVAGAIALGGPGAIFWMWLSGLLGMATKFAEATLAIRYRIRETDDTFSGGPMYMIRNGMGKKWNWLAGLYCFFGVVAAFGVGNATQINTVIAGLNHAAVSFGITPSRGNNLLMGAILAVMVTAMLLGGAKRIGRIAEQLVPFASAGYLLLGMLALIMNYQRIPQAFSAIISGAFSPQAVTGGMVGSALSALRVGTSRGVFTNEAGMGTASIAHAGAEVSHPAEQGLMGIMEVFLDTIVICTITALVILTSGIPVPYGVDTGINLTSGAFVHIFGGWVTVPIALALCAFAFATVLGWGLYGIKCAQFLFGGNVLKAFAIVQGITVLVAAVLETGTVWLLCETVNGLMAIPNLIALLVLSPQLRQLILDYKIKMGGGSARGGTYANFHQCKPLRTFSHAQISSSGCGGREDGQDHLPSEHRPAGSADAAGLL